MNFQTFKSSSSKRFQKKISFFEQSDEILAKKLDTKRRQATAILICGITSFVVLMAFTMYALGHTIVGGKAADFFLFLSVLFFYFLCVFFVTDIHMFATELISEGCLLGEMSACGELLKLTQTDDEIKHYVLEVVKKRQLRVFDLRLCQNLLRMNQEERQAQKNRDDCVALHSLGF